MNNLFTLLSSDTFIINIVSTIIGCLVSFLLDKTNSNETINISISTYVNHNTNQNRTRDDSLWWLAIFIFTICYLFLPDIINKIVFVIKDIILFLLIGSIISKIISKKYDYHWVIAILLHISLWLSITLLLQFIDKPFLNVVKEDLNNYGVANFIKNNYKNLSLITSITIHTFGVFFLFLALKDILISLLSLTITRLSHKKRIIWGKGNVVSIIIILTISYLLVSGESFSLISKGYDIIRYIIWGKRGY